MLQHLSPTAYSSLQWRLQVDADAFISIVVGSCYMQHAAPGLDSNHACTGLTKHLSLHLVNV
jgi:hypothetical protein